MPIIAHSDLFILNLGSLIIPDKFQTFEDTTMIDLH